MLHAFTTAFATAARATSSVAPSALAATAARATSLATSQPALAKALAPATVASSPPFAPQALAAAAIPPPKPSPTPAPPPTVYSSPPPPPLPPNAPGASTKKVVEFELVIAGTIDTFNQTAFKSNLAKKITGVKASQILLTVTAASIKVGVTVVLEGDAATPTGSANIVNSLAVLVADKAALSKALGVTVQSVSSAPAVKTKVITPPVVVEDNSAGILGGIVGGFFALLILMILGLGYFCMTQEQKALFGWGSRDVKAQQINVNMAREKEMDVASASASSSEPGLPEKPGIDPELDAEFSEADDERNRRLEWIRYYVREKDLKKAYDLGWDGKPFRQSSTVTEPTSLTPRGKGEGKI